MKHGCAWGLFDKNGQRDNLGCLNLLTPEVVVAARDEIKVGHSTHRRQGSFFRSDCCQTGHSVSLNWQLNKIHAPGFGRKVPEHRFVSRQPPPLSPGRSYANLIPSHAMPSRLSSARACTTTRSTSIPRAARNGTVTWRRSRPSAGRGH